MSILDFNMPGMDTPEGQGLMAAAMSLLQAQKMPGQRGMFANALGQAGQQYMQTRTSAQDMAERRKFQDLQMRMHQEQLAEAQAQRARAEQARQLFGRFTTQPQPANPADPVMGVDATLAQPAGFDLPGYAMALGSVDPGQAINLLGSLQKEDKPQIVSPGQSIVKGGRVVYQAPDKPEKVSLPTAVQEYEYARAQGYQGTFADWDMARKKAGATKVENRIDNKMGDSTAGQIGPMAKDSRIQAQGAVQMFDAADRIGKALDSNKVTAGPLASQIQTVKQLVQVIGGGNDESIRQTRQVIKSLAQMSVEARKQLQGQGQVTESEAAAVAKADAGDINDLTPGELRDLVTLTKRAAHFRAKEHANILQNMESNDATRPTVPFYRVQGLEPLLNHNPQLPQIGGGSAVDSLVNKYRSK